MKTSEMLRYNDEALKNKETSTIMHSVLSSAIIELQLCVTNSAMDVRMCAFPIKSICTSLEFERFSPLSDTFRKPIKCTTTPLWRSSGLES